MFAIQALNPPHGGATAIYGQCDDGCAIGAVATNPQDNSSGIGVSATTQLGAAGQFQSSGGIGVEASAGLPDKGNPATQGIGVSATGNIAVQAQATTPEGIGVSASGSTAVQATSNGPGNASSPR